eukprot:COSAG02_NODE_55147_length_292_cov_0.792746_1_plen_33_part_10
MRVMHNCIVYYAQSRPSLRCDECDQLCLRIIAI